MWRLQPKRNPFRDRILIAAPEANPHEFVQRYLIPKLRPVTPTKSIPGTTTAYRSNSVVSPAVGSAANSATVAAIGS